MTPYPVNLEVHRPRRMARVHVLLRILLLVLSSWIFGWGGGAIGLAFLGFPVAAAILIDQKGGQRYLAESSVITRWLVLSVGALAYISLLTDELPTLSRPNVELTLVPSGEPTVKSSLMRILLAIPSGVVLVLLGCVSWLVWIVGSASILINERFPRSLWKFQLGIVRWEARLLGYLASAVKPYPPFALDTDSDIEMDAAA